MAERTSAARADGVAVPARGEAVNRVNPREATRLHQLEENLGATKVELTTDDLCDIEEASSRIEIQADRYP